MKVQTFKNIKKYLLLLPLEELLEVWFFILELYFENIISLKNPNQPNLFFPKPLPHFKDLQKIPKILCAISFGTTAAGIPTHQAMALLERLFITIIFLVATLVDLRQSLKHGRGWEIFSCYNRLRLKKLYVLFWCFNRL